MFNECIANREPGMDDRVQKERTALRCRFELAERPVGGVWIVGAHPLPRMATLRGMSAGIRSSLLGISSAHPSGIGSEMTRLPDTST